MVADCAPAKKRRVRSNKEDMSQAPVVRRSDRIMDTNECFALLRSGIVGRLAVVDPDGWPYCVPLLYVLLDETVYVHMPSAIGHLRRSLERSANVCFEVDEPGAVFDYGSFECDSGLAYRSAMVFGTLRVVEDAVTRHRFLRRAARQIRHRCSRTPEGLLSAAGPHHDLRVGCAAANRQAHCPSNGVGTVAGAVPNADAERSPLLAVAHRRS
jgi:nitroimidazol reductase NimA-like FMN-containing flavoprotein (pyridoxamine 5'-phosphate oxidase superfamily)